MITLKTQCLQINLTITNAAHTQENMEIELCLLFYFLQSLRPSILYIVKFFEP